MKITEIVLTPSRDEYNENYIHRLIDASDIGRVPGTEYHFRRKVDSFGDILYGIFDGSGTKLISYLRIDVQPEYAVVGLPSTMPNYGKQGLMVFLYSYAVNKDGLNLMSDGRQTPEARDLWKSLFFHHFFNIDIINLKTGERTRWNGDTRPWGDTDEDIRLLAFKHTNEQVELREQYSCQRGVRAKRRRLGMDNPELYGPECYKIFANPKDIHQ